MSARIDLIAGARPNFMKVSPVIRAIQASRTDLRYRLVHTGQHYDANMSGEFFTQLDIPEPEVNLGVGSGTQAEQAAGIMVGYERLLAEVPTDLCIVVGDVNSTMACAIAAKKLGIRVAHIEGGIRSGDMAMPEEINRIVTDSISDWFFTTSETANANLRAVGVDDGRIFFVGNTMIDTLLAHRDRFAPPEFDGPMGIEDGAYLVTTLHRPNNVDDPDKLARLLAAIGEGARGHPVIFPVHPRTAQRLDGLEIPANIQPVAPLAYLQFNWLVAHAKAVITDSGGITEETTVLGIPCMTLRDSTERPETVSVGTNELLGTDPAALAPALERLFDGKWKKGGIPELWDGRAAERIVGHLARLLANP